MNRIREIRDITNEYVRNLQPANTATDMAFEEQMARNIWEIWSSVYMICETADNLTKLGTPIKAKQTTINGFTAKIQTQTDTISAENNACIQITNKTICNKTISLSKTHIIIKDETGKIAIALEIDPPKTAYGEITPTCRIVVKDTMTTAEKDEITHLMTQIKRRVWPQIEYVYTNRAEKALEEHIKKCTSVKSSTKPKGE